MVSAEATWRNVWIELRQALGPLRVDGDRVQLQQLLLNLIMNAMDAMAETPVVFRKVTLSTAHKEGRKLEIAVSDAGHGIETGAKERLFESFFSTKPKGLGLGLSIARTIAQAHGGRLGAENNPSVGASFRLTLAEAQGEAMGAPTASAEAAATAGARYASAPSTR